jgi:hypothetical protein
MPASISSTFLIVVDETIAPAGVKNIANPGRTLRVVSVAVTGTDNAAVTVSRVTAAGVATPFAAVTLSAALTPDLTDVPAAITASGDFTATDNIRVSLANVGGTSISRVVLVCVGNPAFSLTVT